jgi:HrpA-like RNA helicase
MCISMFIDLKLILMSATVNASLFANYFGACQIIDIPGRTFPVRALYLEDAVESCGYVCDERSEYASKGKKDKKKEAKAGAQVKIGKVQHRFDKYVQWLPLMSNIQRIGRSCQE